MPNTSHSFTLASPYQTEMEELARRQKMAEIMQAQSLQPIERSSYKGIEAPISPLSGLAKALQSFGGSYMTGQLGAERKALGERYQTDLTDTLQRAANLRMGSPAVEAQNIPESNFLATGMDLTDPNVGRVPEGQPGAGNIVQSAYTIPGRPAVAPNEMGAAQEYMKHPELRPFGMATMQKEIDRRRLASLLGGAQPSAQAPAGATPQAAGGPQGAAAQGGLPGIPAGIDPTAWKLAVESGDMNKLATMIQDANKPSDKIKELRAAGVREGSPQWNAALSNVATQQGIWQYDNTGNLRLAPGFAQGQGDVKRAEAQATAEQDIISVNVTQPDGSVITQQMTRADAARRMGGATGRGAMELTAPTPAAGERLAGQLDAAGAPGFNVRVPPPGQQPPSAQQGFGVSDPVAQDIRKSAAVGALKSITDKLDASMGNAQAAEGRINQVRDLGKILDSPLIIGPGASAQMVFAQIANKAFGASNDAALENTRQLITGLSDLSLSSRGALKGQGSVTIDETALLQKAKSAPESLTVPEYKRLFALFERQDLRIIQQHEDARGRAKRAGLPYDENWRVDAPSAAGQDWQRGLNPETINAIERSRRQ